MLTINIAVFIVWKVQNKRLRVVKMTREYKRAEHLSLSSAGASIHKAISALLMLYCTCYSYSSVLRSEFAVSVTSGDFCQAVKRAFAAPSAVCPVHRRVLDPAKCAGQKIWDFFSTTTWSSSTLAPWAPGRIVLPQTRKTRNSEQKCNSVKILRNTL